METVANY